MTAEIGSNQFSIIMFTTKQSIRSSNWLLYLTSMEKMCLLFFVYNRLDYALNIPEYLARMQGLETKYPDIWNMFMKGHLSVQTNTIPFTVVGVDQAQEQVRYTRVMVVKLE